MDLDKLKGQLQTEVDTAFLYDSIAAIQSDDNEIQPHDRSLVPPNTFKISQD